MKAEERDLANLADMLEAAREAQSLTRGITYEGLMHTSMARSTIGACMRSPKTASRS